VPLVPRQDWPAVKSSAKAIAEQVARKGPDRYTSTMAKAQRKGKIFIDYLRNARGATAVATYSTRARAGAPVSWPVAWEALSRLDPQQLTVATAARYLAREKSDPWKGFDRTRQSITQAMLRRMDVTTKS
jgi:bifunctional non-homologous end joining protein LigD